jgi:hypothetical protein
MLAATFDGAQFRLYADEAQVAEGRLRQLDKPDSSGLLVGSAEPTLEIAPAQANVREHFGGKIAGLELRREAPQASRSYESKDRLWTVTADSVEAQIATLRSVENHFFRAPFGRRNDTLQRLRAAFPPEGAAKHPSGAEAQISFYLYGPTKVVP